MGERPDVTKKEWYIQELAENIPSAFGTEDPEKDPEKHLVQRSILLHSASYGHRSMMSCPANPHSLKEQPLINHGSDATHRSTSVSSTPARATTSGMKK
ncbi:hypothetical protein Y1Q_0009889 [Alligator mississippiensis]|uniref:Uncharacterized protein n=1 Tax=Alligator mississippiensis TaxID=8496 RepID=A0A151MXB7_ALLMI|nr:hypothetical protein Y1Q_0009889 [Alligator mississippiensis]